MACLLPKEDKVEIRGIKKSYVAGTTRIMALRSLDLDLEPGESVAIVGVSGCGKTMLLNLFGGVAVSDEGSIRVGDFVLHYMSRPEKKRPRKSSM